MKKKTFDCTNKERVLLEETIYTPFGEVLQHTDFYPSYAITTHYIYNELEQLIEVSEIENGVKTSSILYIYDQEGSLKATNIFLDGELSEQSLIITAKNGYTQTTVSEGRQQWKLVHTITANGYTEEEFGHETRILCRAFTLNAQGDIVRVDFFDGENVLDSFEVNTYNEEGQLTNYHQYHADQTLLAEIIYKLSKSGQVLSEYQKQYNSEGEQSTIYHYEYDTHGNVIHEKQQKNDAITEIKKFSYDDQQRLVSIQGTGYQTLDALGNIQSLESYFHYVYEYKDD